MNNEHEPLEHMLEGIFDEVDFSTPVSEDLAFRSEIVDDTVTVRLEMDPQFILVDLPPDSSQKSNSIRQESINEVAEITGEKCYFEYALASGGMGVVYSATQTELQRNVAVKVLRDDKAYKPSYVEGFLVEARVAAELEHPNIIPVHALGRTEKEMPALVMRKVSGVSWGDMLRDRNKSGVMYELDSESWRIFRSVCNAVAFAHSKGILHLDLKPTNILVGDFGEVLVVDWGIARAFGDFPRHEQLKLPHVKDLKHLCGTPSYMAPEMVYADGKKMGPWTDVYQLGSILYRIIEGTSANATNSKSVGETLRNALRTNKLPFSRKVPAGLKKICKKALSQKIEDRYQTIEELLRAIDTFLGHKESSFLTREAASELEELFRETEVLSTELKPTQGTRLYSGYTSVIGTLENALSLWPENSSAQAILVDAKIAYARLAKDCSDFSLARLTIEGVRDKRVEKLVEEIKDAEQQMLSEQKVQEYRRVFRLGILVSMTAFICGVLALGGLFYNSKKDVETRAHVDLIDAGVKTLLVVANDSAKRIATNIDYVHTELDAFAFQVQTRMNQNHNFGGPELRTRQKRRKVSLLKQSRKSISYNGGTLFLPEKAPIEENLRALRVVNEVSPTLENLSDRSHSIVLLTFVAFETGLYFVYPEENTEFKLRSDYDPRVRPWYRDGKSSADLNQTPPYIGASTKKAVISVTRRLLGRDSEVTGVAAVDCWLNDVIDLPPIPSDWRSDAEIKIIRFSEVKDREAVFEVVASRAYENEVGDGEFSMTTYDIKLNTLNFSRNAEVDSMVASLRQFKSGVLAPTGSDDEFYRAYAPIGTSGDILLIKIPTRVITQQADDFLEILNTRTRAAFLWLCLFALVVVLVVVMARRMTLDFVSK